MKSLCFGLGLINFKKRIVCKTPERLNYSRTMTNKSIRDFGYSFNAGNLFKIIVPPYYKCYQLSKITVGTYIISSIIVGRDSLKPEGQLRKIDNDGNATDKQFQFKISDDHQECQAHYEELGAAITEYVYNLLEAEGLIRLPVPKNSTPETGTFVFASKDYDKKDVLMVLIHGSGAVRAGQWARSLIINENLDMGTQIPYIKEAIARDYAIIVLNTNDNYRGDKKIQHSGTCEEHSTYVWKNYIENSKASNIVIVAHSYGGILTFMLAEQQKKGFEKRVRAIALTESVHTYSGIKITKYLKTISRNWISSNSPLDEPEVSPDHDITRVSAGHPKHEMTSYSCMKSVFLFIESKLRIKEGE